GTAAMSQDLQWPPRMRSLLSHFFNLLRGLPEEEIGTNGPAKDGDDHEEVIVIQQDRRQQCPVQHKPPRNLDRKSHRDIEKQHQGEEFQNRCITMVWHENL